MVNTWKHKYCTTFGITNIVTQIFYLIFGNSRKEKDKSHLTLSPQKLDKMIPIDTEDN